MSNWKSGTLQTTLIAYACSVHWLKCDQHEFHIPVLWMCVVRFIADPHWIKSRKRATQDGAIVCDNR